MNRKLQGMTVLLYTCRISSRSPAWSSRWGQAMQFVANVQLLST